MTIKPLCSIFPNPVTTLRSKNLISETTDHIKITSRESTVYESTKKLKHDQPTRDNKTERRIPERNKGHQGKLVSPVKPINVTGRDIGKLITLKLPTVSTSSTYVNVTGRDHVVGTVISTNSPLIKERVGKPGDDNSVNEPLTFPLTECKALVGQKFTPDPNETPKNVTFEHKISGMENWTADHDKIDLSTRQREIAFKMLDLGKTRYYSRKRVVEHLQKYGMKFGVNYTTLSKMTTRGKKSYDSTFVYFVEPKDCMLGGWALGAMASKSCFWAQFCGAPMFMDMWITPGGVDTVMEFAPYEPKITVSKINEAITTFNECISNMTLGNIRESVNSMKYRYGQLRKTVENQTPVSFEYEEAPGHYATCLSPHMIGNGFMLPPFGRSNELIKKVEQGEVTMRNRMGTPCRFWNGYNKKQGNLNLKRKMVSKCPVALQTTNNLLEKNMLYRSKILTPKNPCRNKSKTIKLNTKFSYDKKVKTCPVAPLTYKNFSAKEAAKKYNDVVAKQQQQYDEGLLHDKPRQIDEDRMGEFELTNRFMKAKDSHYRLHPGIVNLMERECWGKYTVEEEFIHRMSNKERNNPASRLQMRATLDKDEYENQLMLMLAGASTSPECLQLINSNKEKTLKLIKDRARENFYLANLGANMCKFTRMDEKCPVALQHPKILSLQKTENLGSQMISMNKRVNILGDIAMANNDQNEQAAKKLCTDWAKSQKESKRGQAVSREVCTEDILSGNLTRTGHMVIKCPEARLTKNHIGALYQDCFDKSDSEDGGDNENERNQDGIQGEPDSLLYDPDSFASDHHEGMGVHSYEESQRMTDYSSQSENSVESETTEDIEFGNLSCTREADSTDISEADENATWRNDQSKEMAPPAQIPEVPSDPRKRRTPSITEATVGKVKTMLSKLYNNMTTKKSILELIPRSKVECITDLAKWKKVKSNSRRPFNTLNGFEETSVTTYDWSKQNPTGMDIIETMAAKYKWQSILGGYSPMVQALVDNIVNKAGPEVPHGMKQELIDLSRALHVFQLILDDKKCLEKITKSTGNDEWGYCGLKIFPMVSKEVFALIVDFLPVIEPCIPGNFKFVTYDTKALIKNRLDTILKNKTRYTETKNEIKIQNKGNFIIANKNIRYHGCEVDDLVDRNKLIIKDAPLVNAIPPVIHSAPKGKNKKIAIVAQTSRDASQQKTLVYPSLIEGKQPTPETVTIKYETREKLIGPTKLSNTKILKTLKMTDEPLPETNPKSKYTRTIINEQVKFNLGNAVYENPQMPGNEDMHIRINNGSPIKLKHCEKPPPKQIIPLGIVYANLNPNILIKMKNLTNSFPYSAFCLISELRCSEEVVRSGEVVPVGYYGFCHTGGSNGRINSSILVKNCYRKSCKLILDENPFTVIKFKHDKTSVALGCFYIPPPDSKLWQTDLDLHKIECSLKEIVKIAKKMPMILAGDINVELEKPRNAWEKKIANMIDRNLSIFKRHKTDHTFERNDLTQFSKLDYMWTKNLDDGSLKLFDGRTYAGNDGHKIFEYNTRNSLVGVVGKTIINRRPKLNPETVKKVSNDFYKDFKSKLDEKERIMLEKLNGNKKFDWNETLNKNDIDEFDNEYCEYAFNFLEELFSALQPTSKEEVWIYNNHKVYGEEVSRLRKIIDSLNEELKNNLDHKRRVTLESDRKIVRKKCDKFIKRDGRRKDLGTEFVDDIGIFELAKARRPKLRESATDQEIFSAQELANEFKRLYKSITEHVKLQESSIDVTSFFKEMTEDEKFSFKKWFPNWNTVPRGMRNSKIKTIEQCLKSLKPVTRGLNSSLYRDALLMLDDKYFPIIEKMVKYWANGGNYPEKFLTGKLKPILKKGDIDIIKNRRFISVGNVFQQLLGKIIASALLNFVEHHNILSEKQWGFRSGRSCELAVANLIYKAKRRPKTTVTRLIFLDLSSAFFCVKKDELLKVLGKFVRADTLRCLEKMLLARRAVVISEGVESDEIEIEDIGVPQGEACSPLFFILIMNGIFIHVSETDGLDARVGIDFQGFADDSQLEVFSNCTKEIEKLSERGWKKTKEYVQTVGFKINPTKSEAMHFGPKAKIKKLEKIVETEDGEKRFIETSDGLIEVKEEIKILGLRIDEKMTFAPQFEHVVKKLKAIKYIMYDLLGGGTSRQLIKVAFSKSAGVYLYGIGIQPKWTDEQYKTVQSIIKDCIKIAYGTKVNHFKEISQRRLLRSANWMPVRIQHMRAGLTLLNKLIMNKDIKQYQEILSKHLYFEDGSPFKVTPYNKKIPVLKITEEDKKWVNPKLSTAFPLTCSDWLNDLPNFIKMKLGTPKFHVELTAYCKALCWHRKEKDCSHCKDGFENEIKLSNYEELIKKLAKKEKIDPENIESTLEQDHELFEEAMNDDSGDDLINELVNAGLI